MAVDYFSKLTDLMTFKAGDVIFDAGEPGDVMYVVREGQVEIAHRGHLLEVCTPGDWFGEMALVDGRNRAARAVARTDVELGRVNRQQFLFLVQETPTFALQAMHRLAERIRDFDEAVGEGGL